MKISSIVLALATVGMVANGQIIDCKPQLNQYLDAANQGKCISMAGGGLMGDGSLTNFKGNLNIQNGALHPVDNVNVLSSTYYNCDSNNRFQPFLADNVNSISDFFIYSNASVQVSSSIAPMTCIQGASNLFYFNLNNIVYSLVMSIRDSCDHLNFGEYCSNPTSTPSSTPSSTPTQAPSSISFELKVTNSWMTGADTFTQYDVNMKNNGAQTVKSLDISFVNFEPTDKWNIETLPNGHLTMPSYGTIAPGQTYTFGFITKSSVQPSFAIVSSA